MPALRFKLNCTVCFSAANSAILDKASQVFFQHGYDCVVTSGLEGTHGPQSKHYQNAALDFGVHHIKPEHLEPIKKDLCAAFGCRYPGGIGPLYDVLEEGKGTPNHHIHIEEDVKHRRGP